MKKERPILFSGPLVRAILDGRKTVTRRVMKPPPIYVPEKDAWVQVDNQGRGSMRKPYGIPGDRLWVRETFRLDRKYDTMSPSEAREHAIAKVLPLVYETRADGERWIAMSPGDPGEFRPGKWRPSIHMPRWASRIDLEVLSVRAERIQQITTAEIEAEGLEVPPVDCTVRDSPEVLGAERRRYARTLFADLWDRINAKRDGGIFAWARNPWVWRVEFRRVDP